VSSPDPSGIIGSFPDPMLLVDPDGTILAANPRTEGLFRRSPRALIGAELGALLANEKDELPRYLRMCRRTSEAIPGRLRIRLPNGEVLPCKADGGFVRRDGRDDPVIWLRLLSQQSTLGSFAVLNERLSALSARGRAQVERKRAAEELRQSEERFRLLVDSIEDYAIYILDLEGRIASWNPGAERIKGYRAEEVLGRHYSIFYPPEDVDRGIPDAQLREALLTSRAVDEGWRIRKDGSRFWANGSLAAIRNGGGNVIGFAKITRDLTERRETEEALRESEARTRLIFDTALDAVITIDEHGLVTEWNGQAERMFGWPYGEAIGRRLSELLIPPRHRAAHENGLRHFLATGAGPILNRRVEITAVRRGGGEFPVELTVAPYRTGETWLFSGFVRDITARKRAEEALRESEIELARISRLTTMGELTASIAHELRQPLTAAVTNGTTCKYWLSESTLDIARARRAAERMIASAQRASGVMDRVRTLLNKTPPERIRLDINELIRETLAVVDSELRVRQVAVITELSEAVLPVIGDRIELQQVLLNLILNGVEAMIPVSEGVRGLKIRSRPDGATTALVAVEDSGTGLDPAIVERIFDPFFTTKSGGMGMGLSICRSIIEGHGGRLWASPIAPRGTSFRFTLPATPAATSQHGA
jgi:PAS domain S-box-containing protein